MQIAVHVMAYDVNLFINAMLRNAAPHVDKIYVAHPKRPWNYIPENRLRRTNPTKREDFNLAGLEKKVEIIEGDWETEEGTREACFARAKAEGFDWFLIQDADEFYTESDWLQIRRELENDRTSEVIQTTWYQFWKSSQYVLVLKNTSIKGMNAGFAVRCKPELKFTDRRATNARRFRILDCPCYHYGYVMSDRQMHDKVTQWGHARDFNGLRWYNLKWRNWNEATVDLGPIRPAAWKRAIRFPLHQPEFASEFALPVVPVKSPGLGVRLETLVYDTKAETLDWLRGIKSSLLGS